MVLSKSWLTIPVANFAVGAIFVSCRIYENEEQAKESTVVRSGAVMQDGWWGTFGVSDQELFSTVESLISLITTESSH